MDILLANKFFHLNGGSERVFFQEREYLIQSGHSVVDFSMDIVEIKEKNKWVPCAKRGKLSFKKQTWRCPSCFTFKVTAFKEEAFTCPKCGKGMEKLLHKVIDQGGRIYQNKTPSQAGFQAVFIDPFGNKIGLYSPPAEDKKAKKEKDDKKEEKAKDDKKTSKKKK